MGQGKKRTTRRRRGRKYSSRGWWFFGGGILLALAAGFFAIQGPGLGGTKDVPGTPELTADKQTIDLGDVRLGQTVSVSFELRNDGDGTLHFKEVPYVEVVEGC